MNALTPCPTCRRHVRASEVACPFCASALALADAHVVDVSTRLGRAAMFALRATTAVALTTLGACGDDHPRPPPTTIAPPDTSLAAPYGAPPIPMPPSPPPTTEAPPPIEPPPPIEAPESAAPHRRSRLPSGGGVHALYGSPPGYD